MIVHFLRAEMRRASHSVAAFFCLVFFSGVALAQVCASPGLDGPAVANGIVNAYYAGSGFASVGDRAIKIASVYGQRSNAHQLVAGDMILLMQMQDSSSPATAGRYEYAQIVSTNGIAPSTLQLSSPLVNDYAQSFSPGPPPLVRTFQVVWVPQYSSLSVPATNSVRPESWTVRNTTGYATGGVVAVDVAGLFQITGSINASGAGFRGGAGFQGGCSRTAGLYTDLSYNYLAACPHGSIKGEGVEGTPPFVFDGTSVLFDNTLLLGQGYAGGAGGRGARFNAGGAGNDGAPATGGNQYNSGGGGGGNAGAGGRGGNSWNGNTSGPPLNSGPGNTGNDAGGLGGTVLASSPTQLVMGGGGGAGGANNSFSGNSVTQWPPSPTGGGATGAISSSGASGGGIVLIRAGTFAASPGALIDASGFRAYDKNETDGGGGGGAGGSVYIQAKNGSGVNLNINAAGGTGGSTNNYNHGPGGGGGGGYVFTSFSGASINLAGGNNGLDGCCGGSSGNGSPKAYNSTPGATGLSVLGPALPYGVQGGALCLPSLTLSKRTTTPSVLVPDSTTAQYVITIANTAASSGAAYGVSVADVLPVPFGLSSVAATASYALSGTGTQYLGAGSSVPNSSGVTSTLEIGRPGGVTNTFVVSPGGSVTLTFTVILNTLTVATFQNSATLNFIDPTRILGSAALAANVPSNPTVSPGQTFASGGTVQGSNYASASSTAEDVYLYKKTANLTISKTNGVNTLNAGQTTSYSITIANLGPADADGSTLSDPTTTGLQCTDLKCSVDTGSALCPATLAVSTLQSPGLKIDKFPALSSITFQLLCSVTATGL